MNYLKLLQNSIYLIISILLIIPIANIDAQECDNLLLWNKLGSVSEVVNSETGPSMLIGGSPTFESGKFGNAATFDNNNEHITVQLWGADEKKWGVDEFTFEFWCRINDYQSLGFLFDFLKGREVNNGFLRLFLDHTNTGKLYFKEANVNDGDDLIPLPDGYDFGQWHHYALAVNATHAKVYYDGQLMVSRPLEGGVLGTSMPYELGLAGEWQHGSNFYLKGSIDNLKVYECVKTDFSDRFTETPVSYCDPGTWNFQWETQQLNSCCADQILADNEGNVYVAGEDLTGTSETLLLIKYDSDGNKLWERSHALPDDGASSGIYLAFDHKENVIVTGNGNWLDIERVITVNWGKNGDFRWANIYNHPAYNQVSVRAITTDQKGNTFLTGNISPSGYTIENDIFTIMLDDDGDLEWERYFDGSAGLGDFAGSIDLNSSGDVFVGGTTMASTDTRHMMVIKYNDEGEEQWVTIDDQNTGYAQLQALEIGTDEKIYISGNSADMKVTLKFEEDGEMNWRRLFYDAEAAMHPMALDRDNNVYVAGTLVGTEELVTVKYDSEGVQEWFTVFSYPGVFARDIEVDAHQNIYVLGGINGEDPNKALVVVYDTEQQELFHDIYSFPHNEMELRDLEVAGDGNFYFSAWDDVGAEDMVVVKYEICESMKDYVLIATDGDIEFDESVVYKGGIGIMSEGDEVEVEDGAMVSGTTTFVKATDLDLDNNSVVDIYIHKPATPQLPSFRYNNTGAGDDLEINVQSGETMTLSESVYEDIKVASDGILIFSGHEDVYIEDLKIGNDAAVVFDQCTNLMISGKMKLGKDVNFNMADSKQVTAYVEDRIEIKKRNKINSNLYSKEKIELKRSSSYQHTQYFGIMIGKKIEANEHGEYWSSNATSFDCDPATSPNAIVSDLKAPFVAQQKEKAVKEAENYNENLQADFTTRYTLFPNPATHEIHLSVKEQIKEPAIVSIFNMQGTLMTEEKYQTLEKGIIRFDLNGFVAGIYTIKITTKGLHPVTKRFVVQGK